MTTTPDRGESLRVEGARRHNLKNISLSLPLRTLTVVTGVSGAGKSSLAFDTLHAEGQRRYVESFSTYARQFLERIERPPADRLERIPVSVAIERAGAFRTSRSTVATMTEIADYTKLLFARLGARRCAACGGVQRKDRAPVAAAAVALWPAGRRIAVGFVPAFAAPGEPVESAARGKKKRKKASGRGRRGRFGRRRASPDPDVTPKGSAKKTATKAAAPPAAPDVGTVAGELVAAGFVRALASDGSLAPIAEVAAELTRLDQLHVVADRLKTGSTEDEGRLTEAFETAFRFGAGRAFAVDVTDKASGQEPVWFSTRPRCEGCGLEEPGGDDPPPGLFSANSPLGACEDCRGFGRQLELDPARVVPDPSLSIAEGAIKPFATDRRAGERRKLRAFCEDQGISTLRPWRQLGSDERRLVFDGAGRYRGIRGFFKKLERKSYRMHVRVLLARYRGQVPCRSCGGSRMRAESLRWIVRERTIGEMHTMSVAAALTFCEAVEADVPESHRAALAPVFDELGGRLRYLRDVGLGYLELDRPARTLSGGERSRAALAASLGASLVDTLFVIDEPTTGLHARDTERLIATLGGLRDAGNTVVVVEHDLEIIAAADHLIDLGPGAGTSGGEVVFEGPPPRGNGAARSKRAEAKLDAVAARSPTAAFLTGRASLPPRRDPRPTGTPGAARIEIRGASANNLDGIDLALPLRRLVVVSGVSGSGKSSLVQEVLVRGVRAALRGARGVATAEDALGAGLDDGDGDGGGDGGGADEHEVGAAPAWDRVEIHPAKGLADVVHVDQDPLTQTPRASVISFAGGQAAIRELFAATADAQSRGLTASDFSTNTGNGRCERCRGAGFERVEMQFLPDLRVRCPDCRGRRFRDDVLRVRWRGRSVADLLGTTIDEAFERLAAPDASAPVATKARKRPSAADRAMTRLLRTLEPLREVGLGYLEIGRSLDGLSAGEAQRLKLAAAVAQVARRGAAGSLGGTLFVLDEPTNGLHLADVAVLCAVIDRLLEDGHSVVVVEHHPAMIERADWVVDLGPEGGDAGGRIVASGPPEAIATVAESRTGAVLRARGAAPTRATKPSAKRPSTACSSAADEIRERAREAIVVRGAREHNLKTVDVDLPRGRFIVLSGPSGSGKSTLAYDILFSEGRRRYMETLSPYARRYLRPTERPDVEVVAGVPPTVAIEQRETRAGRKSTVATVTEVAAFLRVVFARRGDRRCPECDVAISAETEDALRARLAGDLAGKRALLLAPIIRGRKGEHREVIGRLRDEGAPGVVVDGTVHRFDPEVAPDDDIPELARHAVHDVDVIVLDETLPRAVEVARDALARPLARALEQGDGTVVVQGPRGGRRMFSTSLSCPRCGRGFDRPDPRELSFMSPRGWCPGCRGTGVYSVSGEELIPEWGDEDGPLSDEIEGKRGPSHDDALLSGPRDVAPGTNDDEEDGLEGRVVADIDGDAGNVCRDCHGARLRPESLAIRFGGRSIAELLAMPLDRLIDWLDDVATDEVSERPVREIAARLRLLNRVGLRYLTLDRPFGTLSGGEQQRVKLAAQIGAGPSGVLYILDEPTIGLHARDTDRLVETLRGLRDDGSSVIVVEHDEDVIKSAELLVDLGPGGGRRGGEVLAVGTPVEVLNAGRSETARLLGPGHAERRALVATVERPEDLPAVGLEGVRARNLHGVDVRVPLGALTVVTGVSGSGKSTLVIDVLARAVARAVSARRGGAGAAKARAKALAGVAKVTGAEAIRRVAVVDALPIGRTPRSVPLTYVGAFDIVRKLYAATPQARALGFGPGRFSFNVKGGRCEACRGLGDIAIGMSFLPNARIRCDACSGRRYEPQTLRVRWKGLTIAEVLALTVEEAVSVFEGVPRLHRPFAFLDEIGLGYLTLGQPSTTLSGGEAQRIKLAAELAGGKRAGPRPAAKAGKGEVPIGGATLYILDEPTTGLAVGDVERLVGALRKLTDRGDAVCVIEHNLEVIKAADCLIDLGPEGGPEGGQLVAWGPPARLLAERGLLGGAKKKRGKTAKAPSPPRSHTLEALAGYLEG